MFISMVITGVIVLFIIGALLHLYLISRRTMVSNRKLLLELKKREEKLQQVYKELETQYEQLQAEQALSTKVNFTNTKLLRIMAHDVKGPLKFLVNLSELLHNQYHNLPQEEVEDSLGIISKSGSDICHLVESMLQWTKIQSEDLVVNKSQFSLQQLVDEKMEIFEPNAKEKEISISNNIPAEVCVMADKNMLGMVFHNLLSNAVKFTGRGGDIAVNVKEHQSGRMTVSVADNGVGMNDESLEKLMNRDQHYTTAGTEAEPGTGLGMMVAQEMLGYHDTEISAVSNLGQGSSFSFNLEIEKQKTPL